MIKRLISAAAIILMVFLCFCCCSQKEDDISQKIIRFHVIANSDSPEDQELKLNVRNKVLSEIGPKLENSKSKENSKQIIRENIETIRKVAQQEVNSYGKDYSVNVSFGRSVFPAKMYSDIVLPAGEYDALKITIGSGQGKNWWCVMFPPLCFVDITHGITSEETEQRMKTVLNEDEYESITAVKKPVETEEKQSQDKKAEKSEEIEIRFKSVEIIKSLFAKIKNIFA